MSEFYLGEIQIFAFNFAPRGWVQCNGQLLSIQQNAALFAVIGTTYGGNGVSTFQLPNLQSRLPVGQGSGPGLTPRVMGESGGEEQHTLMISEIPQHTHQVRAISNPVLANNTDLPGPTQILAQTTFSGPAGNTTNLYVADSAPANPLDPAAVGSSVGSHPHPNLMPLLAVNFCISMGGTFPSRN